ncbi:flagellar basal-body rod protein FlgF [Candidatus Gottesmanbacteria bacterium]|nr:flagellar basal-body rod protein FlgF [Candidatus Gottesmanbacteria bacterium]
MIQAIYSATAGMINQQTIVEVVTNNLANSSTYGYKSDELSFGRILGTLTPTKSGGAIYSINNIDNIVIKYGTDFNQGGMQRTDNVLDLALDGDGFFAIQYPDGIRYTRSGNFSKNQDGQLVTSDGYPVLGINGPIQLQGAQVKVDGKGQVIVDEIVIDKLKIVAFQDKKEIIKGGYNTFKTANPDITEMPSNANVMQGFLELSNVNVVYEMAKMIEAMRTYEAYQRTIQLINDITKEANNELGTMNI